MRPACYPPLRPAAWWSLLLLLGLGLLLPGTSPAQIPGTLGWYSIPSTNLRSVCPPDNFGGSGYDFNTLCPNVTAAWNSAAFDTMRNRLIVWGGGHNDYGGNELYAVNLNTLTIARLTDPGLPLAYCTEFVASGTQPASRHTYDGVAYMPNVDKLFVVGGYLYCNGDTTGNSTKTWLYSFATGTWQHMNPSGPQPGTTVSPVTFINNTAYDPNTGNVLVYDLQHLYSYNATTNAYTKLTTVGVGMDYHSTGVIDPVRKKFIQIGGGDIKSIDISSGSSYAVTSLSTTGGSAIISAASPGLAYDPVTDRIVAWAGGDTVYSLNLDTNTWTSVTFSGGPAAMAAGTFGRWEYSPASQVFVTVNAMTANAMTFRLTAASGDTTPPTVAITAPAGGATLSGTLSVTATASDNVAVVGVQFKVDGTNSGIEDTSSPYSTSLDTTTLSNGSHTLTAVARDAAGNSTTSANVVVTVDNGGGMSADADFAARCAAAGVVKCWSFDNTTTEIVQNVNLFAAGDGVFRGELDTTMKTSGTGSLHFILPPPPTPGANITGKWEPMVANGGAFNGTSFGAGSTFYIQFRFRISPDMLTNTWDSNWKFFEILFNNSTCGNLATVWGVKSMPTAVPAGYTECGFRVIGLAGPGGDTGPPSPPYSINQFDDGRKCDYPEWFTANHPDCAHFVANSWMTFTFKITYGTKAAPDSRVEAWIQTAPGAPTTKFVDTTPVFILDGSGDVFNTINFSGYMTALTPTTGQPGVTSHMWFDELIISTQPIAAPGASAPAAGLSSPSNVRITP